MQPLHTSVKNLALLAAIGSAGIPLASAETPPSSDNEITETTTLPELEVTDRKVATHSAVGTKINTPILETPQSVSAVTRAEMDARGVQRLTDVVSYTAGVQAEFQGIDSRVDTLKIRGYDTGGFTNNIYLDGLRGPSGGQWTRAQFDPFGFERVEVVKGPSAVLYGQVSPGGLVNIVSKRPTLDPQYSVGALIGSHDTYQGTFDFGGPTALDNVQFRVAGLARTGNAEVDHTDLKRYFIAPSLSWQIGDRTSLAFLAQFQKDEGGSTYQFLPQTGTLKRGIDGYLDPSTFLGEPEWNDFDRTQFAIGYQFEHAFNDVLTARQNLRYTYIDTEYRGMVGTPVDANAAGNYTRRAVFGAGDTRGVAVDTHLQAKFSTGDFEHTLIGGVDFTWSEWDHLRLVNAAVPAINIYNPTYNPGIGSILKDLSNPAWVNQGDQDVTERQTGLYLQEQAVIGKLHATLGVRHDWYDIDSKTVAATGRTEIDETPESTTWRAGLLYLFDNGFAPYASYTTSFDSAPYTSLGVDNRPLTDPTEAEQFEIGLKYKPADNALFTVSLFQLTEENRVVVVQPTPARYDQIGEARTRGAEFEGKVELFQGFDLIASYTYLDSEITKSNAINPAAEGNRLPATPRHIASLWAAYTFDDASALAGLSLGAGVRYVGDSYGNDANTIKIPDYTLFDASIAYDLGHAFPSLQGASLRLAATNLADKRYVANSTQPGAAWYGSGRNVSLSARYAW